MCKEQDPVLGRIEQPAAKAAILKSPRELPDVLYATMKNYGPETAETQEKLARIGVPVEIGEYELVEKLTIVAKVTITAAEGVQRKPMAWRKKCCNGG